MFIDDINIIHVMYPHPNPSLGSPRTGYKIILPAQTGEAHQIDMDRANAIGFVSAILLCFSDIKWVLVHKEKDGVLSLEKVEHYLKSAKGGHQSLEVISGEGMERVVIKKVTDLLDKSVSKRD